MVAGAAMSDDFLEKEIAFPRLARGRSLHSQCLRAAQKARSFSTAILSSLMPQVGTDSIQIETLPASSAEARDAALLERPERDGRWTSPTEILHLAAGAVHCRKCRASHGQAYPVWSKYKTVAHFPLIHHLPSTPRSHPTSTSFSPPITPTPLIYLLSLSTIKYLPPFLLFYSRPASPLLFFSPYLRPLPPP